ncbi:zinc finger protein 809-like [Bradysia coprophila]|uniref:zinc finger protein 809-like n=1 Tax=Bradysia coprophila TaxID=38358 RepID=UPI00187D9A62|nr:zinc finger protein 809-like [Bradysia coprophila]
MDSESPLYKTAELVRDAMGCYYFICLQCGKDFENLDDTVMHIEKYFYEPSEDENVDALTPMTINEPDWMSNDSDVEAVVANIKKESFEEYEDYKLSVPDHQSDGELAVGCPIYCPLCSKTLSHMENSLESHLMDVHHRPKNHAKIYECKICGRNSFTRSYDLERHKLTHVRYINLSAEASPLNATNNFESQRRNGERNKNSVLLNILSQSARKPTTETFDKPIYQSKNVSPVTSNAKVCTDNKRYLSTEELNRKLQPKNTKQSEETVRTVKTIKSSNFCSICRTTLSKKETLESHLIRVHHRNKSYAQVYECNICGKNSFTRPYDLRRHQLIHLTKGRIDRKTTLPKKVFKTEPKTDDKTVITHVPLTKRMIKSETSQATGQTEVKKIAAEIRTTNPQKDGILCAICDMKFESYLDVTMHLKVAHNQKRIYKCSHSDCDADSFSSAFLLHRHEISHYRRIDGNNPNRMKCVFCRRSFNKKWNLMKHEKRHLVEMAEQ